MATQKPFDISLGLENTHVLITGGCGLIGRVVVDAFVAAGAQVTVIDLEDAVRAAIKAKGANDGPNVYYLGADISNAASLDEAFLVAGEVWGPVECLIALASIDLSSLPQTESLCDANPEVWRKVFDVNINGTFLTCQRWLRGVRDAVAAGKGLKNVNCILMGSESGKFGVGTMAAYAAGKAAVQYGLLQSLAKDAPRIYSSARVNAVAPGAVDTERFQEECERYGEKWKWEECEATVPLANPVSTEHVARTILMLASESFSGSTHGQVVHVDGGKTGSLVWDKGEAGRKVT